MCGGELYQRADDNESTIMNRLKVYAKDTQPLMEYYTKKGLFVNMPAENGVNEVKEAFKALIKSRNLVK